MNFASIRDVLQTVTLELPLPPSVNRFQARLGNQTPAVKSWVRVADLYLMGQKPLGKITGPFIAEISLSASEFGQFDPDNRVKPLMDYLQRIEVIENDKLCWLLIVRWRPEVAADHCKVELRPRDETAA